MTTPATSGPVRIALVGAGEFGRTLIAQARRAGAFALCAVCDSNLARARDSLRELPDGMVVTASSRRAVAAAMERGQIAIVEDMSHLEEAPLDVVVEATGNPGAAADVAARALAAGFHSVMATKEAEVVVGPALQARARAAGLVHTLADGDQPSLLVALVERARLLGFPVVAAGKSTESDYVLDAARDTVSAWGRAVTVPGYARLWDLGADPIPRLSGRKLTELATVTVPDLCEMTIVANHTGLQPDTETLHGPVARTLELAGLFRTVADGGLLARAGVVDVFTCLRRPDEPSFAGGVFVVVEAPDVSTGRLFGAKGLPISPDGRHVLLHNPVHLLGAEALASVYAAARLNQATGGMAATQRHDLVAYAARDLAPGERLVLGDRHAIAALSPAIRPALRRADAAPIPYYLAAGAVVSRPVQRGAVLRWGDVQCDLETTLARLRAEQERMGEAAAPTG